VPPRGSSELAARSVLGSFAECLQPHADDGVVIHDHDVQPTLGSPTRGLCCVVHCVSPSRRVFDPAPSTRSYPVVGTVIEMPVPSPGADSMVISPPSVSTRR